METDPEPGIRNGGVLVTGGPGYIGSHVALALLEAGRRAVVLDDLSTGQPARVPPAGTFLEGDAGNRGTVREVLDAVQAEAGLRLDIREGARRAGDPPALVADAGQIRGALRWTPRHDDLGGIIRSALAWSGASTRAGKPEPE